MKRNLFEVDNARNLTTQEVVDTFVPTGSFWRLLSNKNHVVLGARGSGKTVIARMLSHEHLSKFDDPDAKKCIEEKKFIGIYVSTRLEWVSGLRNKPWQNEREAEEFFQWRLNVAACSAFLATLKSCLDTYVVDIPERIRIEYECSTHLSQIWSDNQSTKTTIKELQTALEDVEHDRQAQLARIRVAGGLRPGEFLVGTYFDIELFAPLRKAIRVASDALQLPPSTTWMLCLDEAEFLEEIHHRILNSQLRSASGNLVFKLTTMPYFHRTLATNTGAPLNVGHDFEYVYIDRDPIAYSKQHDDAGELFAQHLFEKRAKNSSKELDWESIRQLLGESRLLEQKASLWESDSEMMKLLYKHANAKTVVRAQKLFGSKNFRDQIARKMHSALLLREEVEKTKGRAELTAYSGLRMAIRCSDANPRRLIRIFNGFSMQASQLGARHKTRKLSENMQTTILTTLSESVLNRVQSEPEFGRLLFDLLNKLGSYMHSSLHEEKLSTDQITSVMINTPIADNVWECIKIGVSLGLLFPNTGQRNTDQMPERTGTFHLAYVLAPHFQLLPRRGKATSLDVILSSRPRGKYSATDTAQLDIFR